MLSPVNPVHVKAAADLVRGAAPRRLAARARPRPRSPRCSARSARGRPARMWRKLLAFLGPGYLVAVGYMDPGNWATSLAGGSKFGYALLFIALLSNIMAIILQALCARLGIASGRDLAQACRDAFPRCGLLSALGARRARHLRHRLGRGDRHRDRPQSSVRHSARDRRACSPRSTCFSSCGCRTSASAGSRPSSSRMLGGYRRLLRHSDRHGRSRLGRGDPRLRADGRDREEPGNALSRARHHRRDGDAA